MANNNPVEDADTLILDAQKLEGQKNYAQAIEVFGKALATDSRRLDALSGLLRCAQAAPDAYYKARGGSALNAGLARQADIEENRSHLIEEFNLALKAEQEVLEGQLGKLKSRLKAAGADSAFWLTGDEVGLIAGARVLKSYGFGTAKLNIQSGNVDLAIESVRKGSPKRD